MSAIYLIRHGQASFGHDHYDRLSTLGVRQSRLLAQYLFDTGFMPDAVYCGPLSRHRATAEELLACYSSYGRQVPEPEIAHGFDEYDAVTLIKEMSEQDPLLKAELPLIYTSNASFKRVFETATLRWAGGEFAAEGVEPWEELKARVMQTMRTIVETHGPRRTVAVFTSGGAISAALSCVLGLSGDHAMRLNWQIVNSSVTRFLYDAERITLAGFNSCAHLELCREPSLITYR
jgi:broad specificity phosphatase PhoE